MVFRAGWIRVRDTWWPMLPTILEEDELGRSSRHWRKATRQRPDHAEGTVNSWARSALRDRPRRHITMGITKQQNVCVYIYIYIHTHTLLPHAETPFDTKRADSPEPSSTKVLSYLDSKQTNKQTSKHTNKQASKQASKQTT